jgi:hypothetical protein
MATLAAVASAASLGQSTLTAACRFATDSPFAFLTGDDGNYITADDGTRILINLPGSSMRGMCVARASLSTPIQFATDYPGAIYLTTDGGDHITGDDGTALLVSSPQRGSAIASASLATISYVAANACSIAQCVPLLMASTQLAASAVGVNANTAALQSSIQMGAGARGLASASALANAASLFSVAASSTGSASATAVTGIVLGASLTGITYASVALGGGMSLAITAAGLASATGALFTQIPLSAAASGLGSAAAQFATANQLAAVSSAVANAQGGLSASLVLNALATGLTQVAPALSTSITAQGTAAGLTGAQAALATGVQLATDGSAASNARGALSTAVAAYSAQSGAVFSASAALNGNVNIATAANSNFVVTARLLTVLQPPGEFADIRWLRVPRGGDVAYAEFFQGVGEQLWYGVNWEDWLASNWEANSSALVGQVLRPTIANGLEFACITAGQTGAVEPTWAAFVGGQVIDGSAIWQGQPISSASLDDTISGSSFSAPAGITLDSAQIQTLRSYLIIETPAALVGTDYNVLCTIYTTGGQQKIAKLRIKVR